MVYYKDNLVIYGKVQAFQMTQVSGSYWYDGYRAFMKGDPNTDNPHPYQTPGYFGWANGWNTARQDFIEQRAKNGNPARPENPLGV